MARTAQRQGHKRQRRGSSGSRQSSALQRMHLHAAGIDVGATQHWVAVPDDRDPEPIRQFGAFTADLYALAEWLRQCRMETVVSDGDRRDGVDRHLPDSAVRSARRAGI
jgi:hypothetical protein